MFLSLHALFPSLSKGDFDLYSLSTRGNDAWVHGVWTVKAKWAVFEIDTYPDCDVVLGYPIAYLPVVDNRPDDIGVRCVGKLNSCTAVYPQILDQSGIGELEMNFHAQDPMFHWSKRRTCPSLHIKNNIRHSHKDLPHAAVYADRKNGDNNFTMFDVDGKEYGYCTPLQAHNFSCTSYGRSAHDIPLRYGLTVKGMGTFRCHTSEAYALDLISSNIVPTNPLDGDDPDS